MQVMLDMNRRMEEMETELKTLRTKLMAKEIRQTMEEKR
jgi:hypothetical protein